MKSKAGLSLTFSQMDFYSVTGKHDDFFINNFSVWSEYFVGFHCDSFSQSEISSSKQLSSNTLIWIYYRLIWLVGLTECDRNDCHSFLMVGIIAVSFEEHQTNVGGHQGALRDPRQNKFELLFFFSIINNIIYRGKCHLAWKSLWTQIAAVFWCLKENVLNLTFNLIKV